MVAQEKIADRVPQTVRLDTNYQDAQPGIVVLRVPGTSPTEAAMRFPLRVQASCEAGNSRRIAGPRQSSAGTPATAKPTCRGVTPVHGKLVADGEERPDSQGAMDHVTGKLPTEPVKTMLSWNGVSSSKMFAATDTGLYDVTSAGTFGAVSPSLTNGRRVRQFRTTGGSFWSVSMALTIWYITTARPGPASPTLSLGLGLPPF